MADKSFARQIMIREAWRQRAVYRKIKKDGRLTNWDHGYYTGLLTGLFWLRREKR